MDNDWSPVSWHDKPVTQQPAYEESDKLESVLSELGKLPPLVTSGEVLALKQRLAQAQEGKAFLLQGGDCAERFDDCTSGHISNNLKVLLQMNLVLVHGLKLPVVRIGRIAGQYAKPRSADVETRQGVSLPSYRGDFVNGPEFTAEARRPDPQRMLRGHAHSAMTMNFVRSLLDGGFADAHHPEYWDLEWMSCSPMHNEYRRLVQAIGDSVRFVEALSGDRAGGARPEFYTSHEALVLQYEQSQTRQVPRQDGWFNLSTHFPWIGMRTAHVDGAHVEYCRGVRNPIAVKVGPGLESDHLKRLLAILNPDNEPGRLTLIHRMGERNIENDLPPLIAAVCQEGARVLWCCDAMHGNTETLGNGVKTRRFENIRTELERAFDVHAACGSRLGGVHLEMTGENVTECLGGARNLREEDLARHYRSQVDPRLNCEQALELAMLIVRKHTSAAP
ncbi:3-deoxy-7-phosphoheptulonate synthase class II [Pendulispora brunnea]|uniref:Phospho-2-dehydro-3-deoxyheptonate aldolase n=1 Tax=Pendulispora brunnea TaxID=2905690 RepID=A0ABZ2KE53_9BACT